MVNRIKKIFSREIKGMHEAAYLLAFFSILSQVFALIRDRFLAGYFGTGLELDIYYAAFKLPDLMFVIVSALVSVSVLVPEFVKRIENKKELRRMANSIFTILTFVSVTVLIIAFIFAEKFLGLIVPDLFNSQMGGELIMLTRIILVQPILLSFSSFIGSLVQAYKKFIVYAISPILYNLGIIIGITVFYPIYGLSGLAYGIILGALLHLSMQIPYVFEEKIYPKIIFNVDFKKVFYIFANSLPRTASMLANQGILIFMTFLASTMVFGSLSTFNLSYNLQSVPLAIIGVSYSLAAFPTLSKYFQQKDLKSFYENINKAMRHIIFWSLPVMAMFVVLRAQIVRVILGSGNFDWDATRLVAASLAIFTVSIFAQSISLLFLRSYYAMGKTLKPFFITVAYLFSVILSSYFFVKLLNSEYSLFVKELLRVNANSDILVLALPMAFSVGQIIYMILLILFFDNFRKVIKKDIFTSFWQSLVASLIAFIVTLLMLNILNNFFDLNKFFGVFFQGFISGIIGLFVSFSFLILIGNREIQVVIRTLKTKVWKARPLPPEVNEEI